MERGADDMMRYLDVAGAVENIMRGQLEIDEGGELPELLSELAGELAASLLEGVDRHKDGSA